MLSRPGIVFRSLRLRDQSVGIHDPIKQKEVYRERKYGECHC